MVLAASCYSPREMVWPTTTKQVDRKLRFHIPIGRFLRVSRAITMSVYCQHSSKSGAPVVNVIQIGGMFCRGNLFAMFVYTWGIQRCINHFLEVNWSGIKPPLHALCYV